jgi:hypothetical protein
MSASVISGIGELNGQISNASQNERQNIHSQVEHDGKQKDEACDSQIDPLHILQRTLVVANMIEDGIRSNDRRYDSTDTKNEVSEKLKKRTMVSIVQHSPIERLREVDTDLRVLRRTANSDIRVRSSLQGA